uniref:G domain-containing protein n=1 Tax=Panagrolaimus sp. ES5 TaxID=591445 RepID=A0AC34GTQ5_9BILA
MDNSNGDKNNQNIRNEPLKNEAVFYANLLNDKLKKLSPEDARIFLDEYGKHAPLLPKNNKKLYDELDERPIVPPRRIENVEKRNFDEYERNKDDVICSFKPGKDDATNNHEKASDYNFNSQMQKCDQLMKTISTEQRGEKTEPTRSFIQQHQNIPPYSTTITLTNSEKEIRDSSKYVSSVDSSGIKLMDAPMLKSPLDVNNSNIGFINTFNDPMLPVTDTSYSLIKGKEMRNEKVPRKNEDQIPSFIEENAKDFLKQIKTAQYNNAISLNSVSTQVANVTEKNNQWVQKSTSSQNYLLNPKKSINILILGQTGVGKSTWINAFANYLIYNTLEEAITAGTPVCVIPTKFSMFDEDFQRHEILFGKHNNEVFSDSGESATQNAKTYLFEKDDYEIYVIDTPGMDDTRGVEQDDANIQKILRAISPFKELHAICFLFKANEARLTQSFRYCIEKLLSNLSKSALNNACFLFTNARGTFYKPGDTMNPLMAYFRELQQNKGLEITINDGNTFCLDNEAFRFICAYFSKVKFGEPEFKTYADSWKHSSQEIIRLLNHAARLRPHNTYDTLSINDTKTWIWQLVDPIISISETIETNIHHLNEQIRELESTNYNISDLHQRTAIPIFTLEIIPLKDPQTVCTNKRCICITQIDGRQEIIYKTVCHKPCYLPIKGRGFDLNLEHCAAFIGEKCTVCRCYRYEHKRILYEQKLVKNGFKTHALQNALDSQKDASKIKKHLICECRQTIQAQENENGFAMHAMAKFSLFLFQNGITQKIDIFQTHLENLIQEQKKLLQNVHHYDKQRYVQLKKILAQYRTIRENVTQARKNEYMTLFEIQDIRQQLFALPLNGQQIAQLFNIYVEVDKNDYEEGITRCDKKNIIKLSYEILKNTFSTVASMLGY